LAFRLRDVIENPIRLLRDFDSLTSKQATATLAGDGEHCSHTLPLVLPS